MKKTGTVKERQYKIETPYATQIKAKNATEAKEKFIKEAETSGASGGGEDSNISRTRTGAGATVGSVVSMSSFSPASSGSQLMKAVSPIEYSFIPADTSLLKKYWFLCY